MGHELFSHTKKGTMSFFHNLKMRLGLFLHLKVVNHYVNIGHIKNMTYIRKGDVRCPPNSALSL